MNHHQEEESEDDEPLSDLDDESPQSPPQAETAKTTANGSAGEAYDPELYGLRRSVSPEWFDWQRLNVLSFHESSRRSTTGSSIETETILVFRWFRR